MSGPYRTASPPPPQADRRVPRAWPSEPAPEPDLLVPLLLAVLTGLGLALVAVASTIGLASLPLDPGPSPRRSSVHVSGRDAARTSGSGGDSCLCLADGGWR